MILFFVTCASAAALRSEKFPVPAASPGAFLFLSVIVSSVLLLLGCTVVACLTAEIQQQDLRVAKLWKAAKHTPETVHVSPPKIRNSKIGNDGREIWKEQDESSSTDGDGVVDFRVARL